MVSEPRKAAVDPIAEARRQWGVHGMGATAVAMAAITSVFRAQQIYLNRIDRALRPLGLTFARYEVLMLLVFSRRGTLPLGILGSRLQVHPTSVTNAVDRLEAQGLIRRVPHPTDRRTTLAELLDEGRERAEEASKQVCAIFADPGLEPADLELLFEVLARLRASAGDFEA